MRSRLRAGWESAGTLAAALSLTSPALAASITADWVGGPGSWEDPAAWIFSAAPLAAPFPSNDGDDTFTVRIDAGAAPDSTVTLATDVVVDQLRISPGDTLVLADGASLRLANAADRPESGVLLNAGTLRVGSESAVAEILLDRSVVFAGGGTVELGAAAGNRIGSGEFGALTNGAGHTIRGSGEIALNLVNDGLIEATGASPLRLSVVTNSRSGTLRAASGGTLELAAFTTQQGAIEVLTGGELRITSGQQLSNRGVISLLGGTLSGTPGVSLIGGRLEGFGTVAGGLRIGTNVRLAPGIDGVGRIDVLGDFRAGGTLLPTRLDLDLQSAAAGGFDQIVVSGTAELDPVVEIRLSLLDGFAPQRGDAFSLLRAASIDAPANLSTLLPVLGVPELGSDLFLTLERVSDGSSESLTLFTKQLVTAEWLGGAGDYASPSAWRFSATPGVDGFPANDATTVFDVRIDSGGGQPGDVLFQGDASVDSLFIGEGNALSLGQGSRLMLSMTPNRLESASVRNDGTLTLQGAELVFAGDVRISGGGTVLLDDADGNRISSSSGEDVMMTVEADAALEGAGVIDLTASPSGVGGTLLNLGELTAIGSRELMVVGRLVNDGRVAATGPGGLTSSRGLLNRGRIEIGAGSVLRTSSFQQQFDDDAVTHIAAGGALFASTRISDGMLALSGGSVHGSVRISREAVLGGFGSIQDAQAGSLALELNPDSRLRLGFDDVGLLEVDGDVSFRGIWELDVAGSLANELDRIVATGTTTLGDEARILVDFLGGFAPSAGDRFDVLFADRILGPAIPLANLFSVSNPGGSLVFLPEIVSGAMGQSLVLRAALPIVASWNGAGVGDWTAGPWSFSEPPASALFPSNDGTDVFRVVIDDGNDATGATVVLRSHQLVDRVQVGAGETLFIDDGRSLTLVDPRSRDQAGELVNDGTVAIGALTGSASLLAEGDLRVTGGGELVLSATNGSIRSASGGLFNIFHGAGHTLRGSGLVDLQGGSILNEGTIQATGGIPLEIRSIGINRVRNQESGVLRAGSSSTLLLSAGLFNDGLLEVHSGGTARIPTNFIQGPTDSALTHVMSSGLLEVTSALFRGGRLIVEGGRIESSIKVDVFSGAVFSGFGDIDFTFPTGQGNGLVIRDGGVIAPGVGLGTGSFEVDGAVRLREDGIFRADIAGVGDFDFLRSTELVELSPEARIEISLQGGFTPAHGDSFAILSGTSVASAFDFFSFAPVFDLPTLPGPLLFTAQVVGNGGGESLAVQVARRITASWQGGDGLFSDARWDFDATPLSGALFPNDTGFDLFEARVNGAGDSQVALDAAVRLTGLTIGSGDTLTLAPGAELRFGELLDQTANQIRNDGLLRVEGDGAGAALLVESGLELSGTGVLELGGDGARIAHAREFDATLVNGAGHTLTGSGTVDLEEGPIVSLKKSFRNEGSVVASASDLLVFDAGFENTGRIEASGGVIQVLRAFTNAGQVEVADGGVLDLRFSGVSTGGSLELDGGTLRTPFGFAVEGGVVSGDGLLDMGSGRLSMRGGALAPGDGGAGFLELVGDLELLGEDAELSIELGGTGAGEYDVVFASGNARLFIGTLAVDLLELPGGDSFGPELGDFFDVVIAAEILFGFGPSIGFALPDLGADLGWRVDVVDLDVFRSLRLTIVPEPGTGLLLGFALALLARARRASVTRV